MLYPYWFVLYPDVQRGEKFCLLFQVQPRIFWSLWNIPFNKAASDETGPIVLSDLDARFIGK